MGLTKGPPRPACFSGFVRAGPGFRPWVPRTELFAPTQSAVCGPVYPGVWGLGSRPGELTVSRKVRLRVRAGMVAMLRGPDEDSAASTHVSLQVGCFLFPPPRPLRNAAPALLARLDPRGLARRSPLIYAGLQWCTAAESHSLVKLHGAIKLFGELRRRLYSCPQEEERCCEGRRTSRPSTTTTPALMPDMSLRDLQPKPPPRLSPC